MHNFMYVHSTMLFQRSFNYNHEHNWLTKPNDYIINIIILLKLTYNDCIINQYHKKLMSDFIK